jgi:hypothetical protein
MQLNHIVDKNPDSPNPSELLKRDRTKQNGAGNIRAVENHWKRRPQPFVTSGGA